MGMMSTLGAPFPVVPAQAGTHEHRDRGGARPARVFGGGGYGFPLARGRRPLNFVALLATGLTVTAFPAAADPVEDFYRGKQIRIYIRAAPGGNYDVYSRVLGRHISRFIPGNPLVLPVNMPGGGGIVALNYVANAAPRDGTVLTMITQPFPI